jgi:prepilin-type N-terminal cleavage/methylation domain-containing protein
MKLFKNIKKTASKGFTLIELLVVIGILGILAAALVATIDPFEQIKKAQDSDMKNLATEFLNANIRYYANHNGLPWSATTQGGTACYSGGATVPSISLNNLTTCLQSLVTDGELKQGFVNSNNLSSVVATNPNPQTNNATDTIVCFLPQSKAQRKDPNAKYNQNGSAASNCISQGGTAACYWCAQ